MLELPGKPQPSESIQAAPPRSFPLPPPPRPTPPSRFVQRVVLPLAVFIVAIGGVAWLVQNLQVTPKKVVTKPPTAATSMPLKFPSNIAVWDPGDKEYPAEFERLHPGHYDYLFSNPAQEDAELGLENTNCDCSSVKIALLTPAQEQAFKARYTPLEAMAARQSKQTVKEADIWNLTHAWTLAAMKRAADTKENEQLAWQDLVKDAQKGITVPAGKTGLFRLSWSSRKNEGEHLRLSINIWMQPAGQVRDRKFMPIECLVKMVPPVRCHPERLELGTIRREAPTTVSFHCWSSTREQLEVLLPDATLDPCVQCVKTVLTPAECEELGLAWSKKMPTRIRSACKVTVSVIEEKAGKLLEMGPFQRYVPEAPLRVRADGEEISTPAPLLVGWVRSEVRVVKAGDPQTKINLGSFRSGDGKIEKVQLLADKGARLKHLGHDPAVLQVQLAEGGEQGQESSWDLRVTAPPGRLLGSLAESSAIVLEMTSPQGQTRRVRVPVSGNAVRD